MILNADQRRFWFNNGFLVLPGFFDTETLDQQVKLHAQVWETVPNGIVVDHLDSLQRLHIHQVPKEQRGGRFKLNDLYLQFDHTRQLSLNPRLVQVLEELQVDKPVLCNTLDLDYGTAQPMHVDSLYMTPASPNNLIASWVALEDGHSDSGPLAYYPGSHMIPQYKFSSGSCHAVPSEMEQWTAHMMGWVEKLNLKSEVFVPKKGDVFIWHAYLMHAGSQIHDAKRTRRSLISHYYSESDCRMMKMPMVPLNGGYWNQRAPQVVPSITPAENPTAYAEAVQISGPGKEKQPAVGAVEHFARTSLHYLRLWRKDAFLS